MNCQEVETECVAKGTPGECDVRWLFVVAPNNKIGICDRVLGIKPSDKRCLIQSGPYSGRTRYISDGVIQIENVTRKESGVYQCECICSGGIVLSSKNYYGVLIVCK